MSATRQYELIYIVSPVATDQEVTDLHTQVETIAGKFSGTLEKTENWGRRKLAYEIGPHREGTYVLETLNGPAAMVNEIERRLKVSDKVIRLLVVRVDEETRIAERKKAERQAAAAARRAARGEPEPVETPADVPDDVAVPELAGDDTMTQEEV